MIDYLKNNRSCAVFALLNMAVFAILAAVAPVLSPDSGGYMEGSIFRAPGYPLFLSLCRLVSGGAYLRVAVVLQTAIAMLGVVWLAVELKRCFRMPVLVFLPVYLALLWPLMPMKGGFIGAQIMTEALSYGLMLGGVAGFVRYVFSRDIRWFAVFSLFAAGAMLVRPQFIFMPIAGALVAAAGFLHERNIRKAVLPVLLSVSAVCGAISAERGYHLVRHGVFRASPGVGLVSAMNGLFLSDDATASFFSEPGQKALFEQCYAKVKAAGMRSADFKGKGITAYAQFYGDAADPVIWDIVSPSLDDICGAGLPASECVLKKDAAAGAIGKTIISRKRAEFVKLMAYKFLARAPLDYWFFMAGAFVFAGILFVRHALPEAALLFGVLLMHAINYFGVGLAAPLRQRLIFPTEMLCAALMLAFLWVCYDRFRSVLNKETV